MDSTLKAVDLIYLSFIGVFVFSIFSHEIPFIMKVIAVIGLSFDMMVLERRLFGSMK